MIPLLTVFICYIVYLTLDAREDYELATKYTGFSHKYDTLVRGSCAVGLCLVAATVLIPKIGWGPGLKVITIFGLFLGEVGWAYFDRIYNYFGKFDWDRIGSGGIDKWFLKKYSNEAKKRMVFFKVSLLIITGALLIFMLFHYHLI